jgi:hypothetical protein
MMQGAVIFVSHDEMFVNKVITRGAYAIIDGVVHEDSSSAAAKRRDELPPGELWILSKNKLRRFDGTFGDYKKIVFKTITNKAGG